MHKGQFIYSIKIGQTFERLTVLKEVDPINRKRNFLCKCKCGKFKEIDIFSLLHKNTQSCGCLGLERRILGSKISCTIHGESHGKKRTPEYRSWVKMKERCYWKTSNRYYRYGARGIKVCDKWLNSYETFLKDMGRKPSKKHSIDRINNDGDYCPQNCRWATPLQQARNTCRTKK